MELTTEELKSKLFRAATVLGDMQTEANAKDQRIKELSNRLAAFENQSFSKCDCGETIKHTD